MQYMDTYQSPLGGITLACEADRLTGLWFDGQKYFGSTLADGARREAVPVLAQAREWLDRYFRGEDPGPLPPLELRGTPLQREVWALLLQIPRGQVTTYGRLAARMAGQMGRPSMSAQAVGGAVGHNPISILVPCHRVVGGRGALTGYAGGTEKKSALLALEVADLDRYCF